MIVSGGPLSSTAEAMKSVYQLLHKKNQDTLLRMIRPFFQMVLNLMGASSDTDPIILSGSIMDEEEELRYAQQTCNVKVEYCIYFCQAQIAFYLHKFERARALVEKCTRLGATEMMISSLDVQLLFLNALTAVAMAWIVDRNKETKEKENMKKKKQLLTSAEKSLAQLQALAAHSPENLNHKVYMIEAELKAMNGEIDEAVVLFQKAMDHAEEQGAMSDRTLACERAGLALRLCGKEDEALDYLEDCCAMYRQWGALIKVNHVKGSVIPQAIYEWEE
jgi:tetratricopeptide (TPR) repeat protein